MTRWRTIAMTAVVSLPLAAGATEPGEPAGESSSPLRVWAVLAAPDLRRWGLEDLVVAGLSEDRTVTLVDRGHLDLVARELSLGSMFEASGAGLRQKAGRIVKADALVLLSRETGGGKHFVRLVVCECRCGARLRVQYVPLEDGKAESAAKQVLAAVAQTRTHFSQGIRRVFGVPPFVSRTLTHGHDNLQRGFSALLANALSARPGVAVIEVEEARQIAREISLTDGRDVDRVVPAFVEGEYTVTRNESEGPVVEFRVRITRSGSDERTLPARKVKLSEAAAYVGVELPALVSGVERDAPEHALTAEQQAAALLARADVFAGLGGWEHSTGLREAALLLKDDVAQRKMLMGEYQKILRSPLPAGMKRGEGEAYRSLSKYRWGVWQLTLPHLEHLIRNDQVEIGWARFTTECLFHMNWTSRYVEDPDKEVLLAAEQARKRFVRGVFGSLLARGKAEFCKEPRQRKRAPFIRAPIVDHFLMRRVDRQALQREDLDFLLDLLENHGAEGVVFSIKPLCPNIGGTFDSDDHYGAGKGDLLALLDRMERSQRLEVRLSAQLGRLHLAWYHDRTAADPIEPILEQAKAMEARLAAHPAIAEANGDHLAWVVYVQRAIANEIRRAAAVKERPPRALPPAEPPVAPPKKPPPQVTYEPLALEVRTLDGKLVSANGRTWPSARKVWSPGLRLLNCGPFDLFWNEGAVLLHRQKDLLEEILVDRDACFGDVKWDGRNLWVGARAGHIRVLTPEGKELLRVGNRQGLPECDRVLLLYPVKEGKIVAVGCFGIHNRIWAAAVELVDNRARVKVFHQGTRLRTRSDPLSDDGADLAAWPTWVHGHRWGKDQPRLLWVGRASLPGPQHPSALEINLETLEVRVSNFLERTPSTAICNSGRFLVHTINGGLAVVSPPGEPLVIPDYSRVKELSTFATQRTHILPYNGRLYVTGWPWCCVDPATWQVDPLRPERVPIRGLGMSNWGVSMHHGILFWSHHSGFYRVLIKAADR